MRDKQNDFVNRPTRCPRSVGISAVALLAMTAVLLGPTHAGAATRKVSGRLTEQAVTGPNCTSPVGLCAAGEFFGPLRGPFELVVLSATSTSDPDVLVLATSATVHTKQGDLTTEGQTLYNTVTGSFSSLDTFTGGTGKWAAATGTLHGAGTFLPATGGEGTYEGVVTTP